jgi:mitochondrial import receptor subunit TOM40
LHLCFYQKASEQVQIGVELETNIRAQESVASLGYQVIVSLQDALISDLICF